MKNIAYYIDNFKMVVTLQKDGGDSCAHGCAIFYGIVAKTGLFNGEKYLTRLERSPGRYCRHPDPTMWYSNPDTLSRDQLTPLLCLLGLLKSKRRNDLFIEHLKHGLFFAWNVRMNAALPNTSDYAWKIPDLTGPEIWACWIRAYRFWPLYPLLMFFDIQTLIGGIQYRWFSPSTIQMNQVIVTDFSTRVMPTLTSLLARFVYGKVVSTKALDANWGESTPFNPPVNQYLDPVIQTW